MVIFRALCGVGDLAFARQVHLVSFFNLRFGAVIKDFDLLRRIMKVIHQS